MKRFICAREGCSEDRKTCTLEYDCPLYIRSIETFNESTNKYKAEKCKFNGEKYDSKKELQRHLELKLLERSGEIKELRRQVKFELIPSQKQPDKIGKRGGIIKGKTIEHGINYVADFTYLDKNNKLVVEDVKGYKIGGAYNIFVIKRKLMFYFYGIKVKEI